MTIRKVANLFSKTANKELDLVGVALHNKYIDPMTDIEPAVTLENYQGHNLFTFGFDPVGAQYAQLNQFNNAVKETESGVPSDVVLEPLPPDKDIAPLTEHVRDIISIGVFMDDVQTDVEELTLNKIKYFKATIERPIADSSFKVVLLFKEHLDDSETFFSGFVDRKLTPAVGTKLLELAGERLCGMPVAYASSASDAMTMSLLPVSSPLAVDINDEGKLSIANDTAKIGLDMHKVSSVHVMHSLQNDYIVTAKAGRNVLIICFHR